MGPDDREPRVADDKAPAKSEKDDWFKQAAARWERQKAEEKARAEEKPMTEEKPAPEPAATVDAPPAPKPDAAAPVLTEKSDLARLSELGPAKRERHNTEQQLEDDLRNMAAVALSPSERPPSLVGVQFVPPPVEESFEVPGSRRKWVVVAAVGGVALLATVGLFLRPKATTPPVPVAAEPAAAVAAAPPAEPPPVVPEKAEPEVAPNPPPKVTAKKIAHKSVSSHRKKSHSSSKTKSAKKIVKKTSKSKRH